jgi:hypothetical protein
MTLPITVEISGGGHCAWGRSKTIPCPASTALFRKSNFFRLHCHCVGRGRGLASMITFDPWALGQGELLLPVGNVRPVQVDIVANVSLSLATDRRDSEAPDWEYQLNGATVLQISNALSQLNLKAGCVRFSALDVRRQKVFADHEDARTLDWSRLRQAIVGVNRNKIEVSTLASQKHEPAFWHSISKSCRPPQARVRQMAHRQFIS